MVDQAAGRDAAQWNPCSDRRSRLSGKNKDSSGQEGKNWRKSFVVSLKSHTFAAAKPHGQVLYGQLPVNPPGLDRSKGSRL